MKRALAVLLLGLTGCAGLPAVTQPEVMAAFTGCAAADVVSTTYALHSGIAHETNPLLAPSVNAHHFLPMVLSKLAVVGLVWWIYEMYRDSKAVQIGTDVAAIATCGVVVNNAAVILKGIK